MVLELAWNPRWVMIMSVNSFATSTFDISMAEGVILQPAASVAFLITASPELLDSSYKLSPNFVSPEVLANLATATCAIVCLTPLEYVRQDA